MENSRYGEWARHYDNLLWTVTAILLAANGALLVHSSDEADFVSGLAIGGLFLTVLTVYFAASMRELRFRFQKHLDPELRSIISKGRILYQWPAFLVLFLAFIVGWTWLLTSHAPGCRLPWLILGGAAGFATIILGVSFNKPMKESQDV
jgi:hypothetical protein